jgi:predicted nucleic acid binding AN1-type Zn finger protein
MNCYVCDLEGKTTPAVAHCRHCGIAMCSTHFEQDMHQPHLSGMVRSACRHRSLRQYRYRDSNPGYRRERAAS